MTEQVCESSGRLRMEVSGEILSRPSTAFMYDVFVLHAPADEWFVHSYLLDKLEFPPERVLLPKTLELGKFFVSEIERGVQSSRVTIVVLSPSCLADDWAVFGEQLAAYASAAKAARGVLVPLLLQDCELPTHIRALIALDFRNPARDVWQSEIDRLRAYLDRPPSNPPDLPCPYPGMRPFTPDDAERFFGRDAELERIIRWLRHGTRELYVIGASGSGKSSLIAAGLVPRLLQGVEGLPRFLVRSFRPGEQPFQRLYAALDGNGVEPSTAISRLLARHASASSLLLVIDQLEELFALSTEEERCAFLAAVRTLRSDPRCVLVFTLRADFYGPFMESALWTDREGEISRIDLGPPRNDELRAVIERPARALGVYFQPELVSRLLNDAAHEPGSLPLLQETMFQLWCKRRDRLLVLADYHSLGDGTRTGLAFAVKEHADHVVGSLSGPRKLIALRILLRLVNFGEGRSDTRRQQQYDMLRSDNEVASDFDVVLRHLVEHRLVTVDSDEQRRDIRVDLAHEILIQAWSTFGDWIRAWRPLEQRRRELEASASAWLARGGTDGGLLDSVELAYAIAWRANAGRQLGHSRNLTSFIAASRAAQDRIIRQRRWRVRFAFSSVVLFAVVTSVLALAARKNASVAEERGREADRQRSDAESLRQEAIAQRNERSRLIAELYQENGRQWLIDSSRPLEALPYLVAAREATEVGGDVPLPPVKMLFSQATRNLSMLPDLRHEDSVWNVAFSPDGAYVVTSSRDRTARVWDARSGKPILPPLRHYGAVNGAAFSPDGKRIVTASADGRARIWSSASGELIVSLAHDDVVNSAVYSPDGRRVVTASVEGTARIWDVGSGRPLLPPLRHRGSVYTAAFSANGARVVTASEDHTARVWDADSGRPLSPLLTHQGPVHSAAFSPDGAWVVTASNDHTAQIWDAVSGRPLTPPLVHDDTVTSAAFSSDGKRVVTTSIDNTARIWDAASGKPVTGPLAHDDAVTVAAFSPDGKRVVTASYDNTARVWDAVTGRPVTSLLEHESRVEAAAFSPDGMHVVTASDDHTARIWNIANADECPRSQDDGLVNSVAFSADGARMVTGRVDGAARVWDVVSRHPFSPPVKHRRSVNAVAFSPDGGRVVTASDDGTAQIWDSASAKPVTPPLHHSARVVSALFSPDGSHVVTVSDDGTARVWDAVSGKSVSQPLVHDGNVMSAAFSLDGLHIVTASNDRTVRIWQVSGKAVSLPLRHQGPVRSAVFSSDGARVIAVSEDQTADARDAAFGKSLSISHPRGDMVGGAASGSGANHIPNYTVQVWDIATGHELSSPLPGRFRGIALSPDGTRFVVMGSNGMARILDIVTGKPLSFAFKFSEFKDLRFSPDSAHLVGALGQSSIACFALPLAGGNLTEWRSIADHASPYIVSNARLSRRAPAVEGRPKQAWPPKPKAEKVGRGSGGLIDI